MLCIVFTGMRCVVMTQHDHTQLSIPDQSGDTIVCWVEHVVRVTQPGFYTNSLAMIRWIMGVLDEEDILSDLYAWHTPCLCVKKTMSGPGQATSFSRLEIIVD